MASHKAVRAAKLTLHAIIGFHGRDYAFPIWQNGLLHGIKIPVLRCPQSQPVLPFRVMS
jgi:hypothetical protein